MSTSPTPETISESHFICGCEEQMRSACIGESFYKKYGDKQYCVFHFPSEEKNADFKAALQRKLTAKEFNFRGVWFPNELPFTNFRFSSQADFSYATFSAKVYFRHAKFNAQAYFRFAKFNAEVDFAYTRFDAEASFYSAKFSAQADFTNATFTAETSFEDTTFTAQAVFLYTEFRAQAVFMAAIFSAAADFFAAKFSKAANFNTAQLRAQADFRFAKFTDQIDFSSVKFAAQAGFSNATFNATTDFSYAAFKAKADFSYATFNAKVSFLSAIFEDYIRFSGEKDRHVFGDLSSLGFRYAEVEQPEHVSFHTLTLRPHWFVDVDARKFDFTNVDWRGSINEEIENLKRVEVSPPHRMLAIVCRHLAVNAEENHRYEEASRFRYMAMDARRLESWRGLVFWKLSWWYWLASGYGERIFQAFVVLLCVWLFFAILYMWLGFARWEPKLTSDSDVAVAKRDEVGVPLKWSRSLTYSLGVMTLQKPEPRPATTAAQSFVMLETILGPVQAALLALAIRRKFMR